MGAEQTNTVCIDRLFMVITAACNQQCTYCDYAYYKGRQRLSLKFIKRQVVPLLRRYSCKVLCVTGGEPALHPQFAEIIETVSSEELLLSIITNGTRLRSRLPQIAPYIDAYMISIDSDTSQRYAQIHGIDAFDEVVNCCEAIRRQCRGVQLAISCLVQPTNISRLSKIHSLAYTLGADAIFFRVPELKRFTFGGKNLGKKVRDATLSPVEMQLLEKQLSMVISQDESVQICRQTPEQLYRIIHYFKVLRGDEKPIVPHQACPIPFNSAVIDDEGYMAPCFYLPHRVRLSSRNPDPLHHTTFNKLREELSSSHTFRTRYCANCMQFQPAKGNQG